VVSRRCCCRTGFGVGVDDRCDCSEVSYGRLDDAVQAFADLAAPTR